MCRSYANIFYIRNLIIHGLWYGGGGGPGTNPQRIPRNHCNLLLQDNFLIYFKAFVRNKLTIVRCIVKQGGEGGL